MPRASRSLEEGSPGGRSYAGNSSMASGMGSPGRNARCSGPALASPAGGGDIGVLPLHSPACERQTFFKPLQHLGDVESLVMATSWSPLIYIRVCPSTSSDSFLVQTVPVWRKSRPGGVQQGGPLRFASHHLASMAGTPHLGKGPASCKTI